MKACRNCRMIVGEEKACPNCQGTDLTERYTGEVIILDAEKSEVAKVVAVSAPGKFAVKVK